jgi:hypothetical protein
MQLPPLVAASYWQLEFHPRSPDCRQAQELHMYE